MLHGTVSVNDEVDCSSFKAERRVDRGRVAGERVVESRVLGQGMLTQALGTRGCLQASPLSLSLCPLGLALLIARACTTANAAVTNNGSSYMKLEFVTEFVTTLYSVLFVLVT